jgi:hypothetical protein
MDDRHTSHTTVESTNDLQPHNDLERGVAEIWADLLRVDRVGADDSFLLLGGESLLATQAASRIRSRFGCEVTIRSVLIGTVREVAAEIEASAASRPRA